VSISKAKAAAVGEDTGDTGEGLVGFCKDTLIG
jgi:hypothetical protein